MTSNERARARETCRRSADAALNDMGETENGRTNDAITALAKAVALLAEVSESQDAEIDELHRRNAEHDES